MSKKIKQLEAEIEELREEMYRAFNNDPVSDKVLTISQKLDEYLNELEEAWKREEKT